MNTPFRDESQNLVFGKMKYDSDKEFKINFGF